MEDKEAVEVIDVQESAVVGRRFVSDTTANKEDDGLWKLVVRIEEYQTRDGETWEKKEVSAMSIDGDMDVAYNTAVGAVMAKFGEALAAGNGSSMFKD